MKETMYSNLVGTLTREGPIYDYWNSEPIRVPFFDEQRIRAVYACNPVSDPMFITDADAALANFLDKDRGDRAAISEPVFKMCNDFIELIGLKETIELYKGVDAPLDWMVRTIEKQGPLLEMKFPEEIWNFVHAQAVHLVRAAPNGETNMYVQILCECDWDEEHGLQIVFKNGLQLVGIGAQDGDLH